jgi:hypothetical protein
VIEGRDNANLADYRGSTLLNAQVEQLFHPACKAARKALTELLWPLVALLGMEQIIKNRALSILKPVILAAALTFLAPLPGLLRLPAANPQTVASNETSNETIVFKSEPVSVFYKSEAESL